ncbi:hydrogenase maturation nickel metallochaperone HypA [Corynebacterium diphtheriae bv. mitis]|uniref:hydrogenase maturation nickel metallochaperone HypA n=1 Tax=Corynebacterium diphtheriae TaxID=1717 RepID=UPI0002602444|nr:hydrogenase maturation nickel metallochaperone HypA [Corynebacterium diphtheriae]EIK56970.1 putative hydrogenase nickel incorporation protein [Corynebacterium diphtheriae bv. intermedius str. NCTC 5011]ERA54241.1 putative hydrogenase nickel incorporation protein [Corynebacterium diphtheriae str. Aberdeen]MCM0086366.1 hydrogenase maturation nickel metallochaperone HypA [Corynebacterium diphtheriae bv. mitis]UEB76201.1 hydrogenase maturation nickel metallochaperone HypA [Corynebacterium diphth
MTGGDGGNVGAKAYPLNYTPEKVSSAQHSSRLVLVHEVALSSQLARAVDRAAQGRRVLVVRVRIGVLRQVVPETLEYAWGFVIKGTPLDGAVLETTSVPLRLRCPDGHITDDGELKFSCATCGAPAEVISGEEFTVMDIEVEQS